MAHAYGTLEYIWEAKASRRHARLEPIGTNRSDAADSNASTELIGRRRETVSLFSRTVPSTQHRAGAHSALEERAGLFRRPRGSSIHTQGNTQHSFSDAHHDEDRIASHRIVVLCSALTFASAVATTAPRAREWNKSDSASGLRDLRRYWKPRSSPGGTESLNSLTELVSHHGLFVFSYGLSSPLPMRPFSSFTPVDPSHP